MFETGTRIVVLASTLRKGLGPRKGSIGYVSTAFRFEKFSDYVATAHEVFFVRYGFEESLRMERKPIICLFPVLHENEEAGTKVRSVIRRIISPKNDQNWNEIRDFFDLQHKIPVVVAIPDNIHKINLAEDSTVDFKAWVNSIVYNQWLVHSVHDALMNGHYNNSKDPLITEGSLDHMRILCTDKDYRNTLLSEIAASKKRRAELVRLLVMLKSMLGTKSTEREAKSIGGCLMTTSFEDNFKSVSDLIYTTLGSSIFNPTSNNVCKAAAKLVSNKHFPVVLEGVEQTKAELLRLSSRLNAAG